MLNSFSPAQIERFKREAKTLSRTANLIHSLALDHIAKQNGYENWSLLMKHAASSITTVAAHTVSQQHFRLSRSTEEMREALRKIPETRRLGSSRYDEAVRQTADICYQFVSAKNAVDFAVEYMECLLTVPRYRIFGVSPVGIELRHWLPYDVESIGDSKQIILNREYKPVGSMTREWVTYEDYPHLHTQLAADAMMMFAHRPQSPGYLFHDGCPPWDSRADAERYLERLRRLQSYLKD